MDKRTALYDFVHIQNGAERTIFLLHGTGGSKDDFLFLQHELGDLYDYVGLQGNSMDEGSRRFFKRSPEGVFDQKSIKKETQQLQSFIHGWQEQYDTKLNQMYFLGYSNGANMILATLLNYPDVIQNSVLLHPMLPFSVKPESLNLQHHAVFITLGMMDPFDTLQQQETLKNLLFSFQPILTVKEYSSGHELTALEIRDVINFLHYDRLVK